MTTVSVRYIVDDVDEAMKSYTRLLDFDAEFHPAPSFAVLSLGDLRLLLNEPGAGGAGQPVPDGHEPEPGRWNPASSSRSKSCEALERVSATTPSEAEAVQILIEDFSDNPAELFEPRRDDPGRSRIIEGSYLYAR